MEKRINAGYEIIQSIRVGEAEFVLGVHETAPNRFVTWKSSPDRQDYYYWGHYMNSFPGALRDLCERALEEAKYLEQREEERQERVAPGKEGKGKNRDMER
ncbi:MAG: hypothetical protein HFH25_04035 [Lachnospiraceae bacterium]|nr:hypothetical protein [Lachnospiraceae bacterium]